MEQKGAKRKIQSNNHNSQNKQFTPKAAKNNTRVNYHIGGQKTTP